ncbi:MAG: flavodoxin domain-containing protein [Candidatus Bathyarchaeota archaeon]|jgi:multimeric flavodoxin WrbA
MKVLVIYDSQSGNTEVMAKAIAEGASAHADVEIKKVGEPFSLSTLADVDGVVFGSPVIYADITNEMKDFMDHLKGYVNLGKIDVESKTAAIFGSYGYDGALVMSELLQARVKKIGFQLYDEELVLVDTDVKYNAADAKKKGNAFGKKFTDSL